MEGVQPSTYQDALALRHDIEYLADGEKYFSDFRAISRAGVTTIPGIVLTVGLLARSAVDAFLHLFGKSLHFNGRTDTYNIPTKKLQAILLARAKPMLEAWNIPATLDQ